MKFTEHVSVIWLRSQNMVLFQTNSIFFPSGKVFAFAKDVVWKEDNNSAWPDFSAATLFVSEHAPGTPTNETKVYFQGRPIKNVESKPFDDFVNDLFNR